MPFVQIIIKLYSLTRLLFQKLVQQIALTSIQANFILRFRDDMCQKHWSVLGSSDGAFQITIPFFTPSKSLITFVIKSGSIQLLYQVRLCKLRWSSHSFYSILGVVICKTHSTVLFIKAALNRFIKQRAVTHPQTMVKKVGLCFATVIF